MQKRLKTLFSGTVQGVGFRYQTRHFARSLKLAGYVRNLSHGQVELVAEGDEADLAALLAQLRSHFESYISDCDVCWEAFTGEYLSFEIRI